MTTQQRIYLDTPVSRLFEEGIIDRTVLRACQAAKPPMVTAGDIRSHLDTHGHFNNVPGCRRPGRIPDTLMAIAHNTADTNTPAHLQPGQRKRRQATQLDETARFDFLTTEQQQQALRYKEEHGHLPMFLILACYLNREDADRNDIIAAHILGLTTDRTDCHTTLADVAQRVGLSRERVRQIANTYTLPDDLMHPRLWKPYADHSTYYVDPRHPAYIHATQTEIPTLTFAAYADILHRTTNLRNIDNRYLARRGWTDEITAWVNRLSRLAAMQRTIDNRLSLEGLAMGGTLDTRLKPIVISQIAPSLGILTEGTDAIILPKNTP